MFKYLLVVASVIAAASAGACTSDNGNNNDGGGDGGAGGADGGGGSTSNGGNGNGGSGANGGAGGGDDCTINGYTVARNDTTYTSSEDVTYHESFSMAAFPSDSLTVELYYAMQGATEGPHMHTFNGENYDTCTTCSLIYENCSDAVSCDRVFLAVEGTLNLTANSKVQNDSFAGTLTNAKYIEVTIEAATLTSTPVPNGDVWCIDSVTFDSTLNVVP